MNCPICDGETTPSLTKDGCRYLQCQSCEFLFHRAELGADHDSILPSYDHVYWEMERSEALRRELEDSFVRALELIYLSTVKVEHILDFGCGLGGTIKLLRDKLGLDAIGVDPFGQFQETSYLRKASLRDLRAHYPEAYFDAIYSIEVFEHLISPRDTLSELIHFLRPGGKILINTGTQEFLARHDPDNSYIDPLRRGHISIYSLKTLTHLAEGFGLTAEFLAGRTYMVILQAPGQPSPDYPIPDNLAVLRRLDGWFGKMFEEYMRLVILEKEFENRTLWATQLEQQICTDRECFSRLQAEFDERSQWALKLDEEVNSNREAIATLEKELRELKILLSRPLQLLMYLWRRQQKRYGLAISKKE